MASPLYQLDVLSKRGKTVRVRLTLVHPDESRFGTDELFAWKLLSHQVVPAEEGDFRTLAARHVKSVALSPVKGATVVKTTASAITVRPKDPTLEKPPSVVYTIEVSSAALLAPIEVGTSEDIFDFVESKPPKAKAGKAPKPAAKVKVKPKAEKAKPAATASVERQPVTFEQLRATALAAFDVLTAEGGRDYLYDRLAGAIVEWADDAGDGEVTGWLERLTGPRRVRTAGQIAVKRALAKDLESARHFLRDAEAHRTPESAKRGVDWIDRGDQWVELEGLIPAWWRLGKVAEADAAFRGLEERYPKTRGHSKDNLCDLGQLASLGGCGDIVARLAPKLFGSPYQPGQYDADAENTMTSGMVALCADGDPAFGAVLQVWNGLPERPLNHALSYALLEHCRRTGRPGVYVEAALEYPRVLSSTYVRAALLAAEKADPAEAVRVAQRVLQRPSEPFPRISAFSTLATHEPRAAEEWAASAEGRERLAPSSDERFQGQSTRLGYLAALGRNEEPRAKTSRLAASLTRDREVARTILLSVQSHDLSSLLMLDALGERATVDAALQRAYDARAKMDPKKRGSVGYAAALGRTALAFAERRLSPASTRCLDLGALALSGSFAAVLEEIELRKGNSLFENAFTTLHDKVFSADAARYRFEATALYLPLRCSR